MHQRLQVVEAAYSNAAFHQIVGQLRHVGVPARRQHHRRQVAAGRMSGHIQPARIDAVARAIVPQPGDGKRVLPDDVLDSTVGHSA